MKCFVIYLIWDFNLRIFKVPKWASWGVYEPPDIVCTMLAIHDFSGRVCDHSPKCYQGLINTMESYETCKIVL